MYSTCYAGLRALTLFCYIYAIHLMLFWTLLNMYSVVEYVNIIMILHFTIPHQPKKCTFYKLTF